METLKQKGSCVLVIYFMIMSTLSAQNKERFFSKDSLFGQVNLHIIHSKRIPYNDFEVNFNSLIAGDVKVTIKSIPLKKELKWEYSKIDTVYKIKRKRFKQINDSINKMVNNAHFLKFIQKRKLSIMGGYKCTLEFGGIDDKLNLSIDSPSPYVESTKDFFNTCFFILQTIGFNPYDILVKPRTPEEQEKIKRYLDSKLKTRPN